jgi:two-component system, OmpR family, sensor histidine kinase SenX3
VHHPVRRDLRGVTVGLDDGRTLVALQDVTESKRVEAMRRDFVADASHELKTPVAAILASAETLEHALADDPAGARRFAASLATEARRLADLVGDLLDLARFEKGSFVSERVPFTDLVRSEVEAFRAPAERKSLALSLDLQDGIVVLGDPDDLALAVRNLLDNAVRYTDAGDVRAHLFARDGLAHLEVRDTGFGIPAKELPRVFERFYRVDKARSRQTGGTGLGLAIVRHVVERSGGEVHAASRLGEGSTFTLQLPLAE